MEPSRVARRYAAALFHIAQRENISDVVDRDLRGVAKLLADHPQVMDALLVPRVPLERKKAVLASLFGDRIQPITRRFLELLVDKQREALLTEVADAYSRLADEAHNVVAVEVRSALPLDEDQTARLKARLDEITGRDARLETVLDPNLVGGLVVRIGDTVIDGSVRGYLEQFFNKLRSAPVGSILRKDSLSAMP